MFFLGFIVLGTLHYGYGGNWSVEYEDRRPMTSICVTIRCSYTYPPGHQVKAEIWTGSPQGHENQDVIVYHTDQNLVDPYFKGRTTYLGHMNGVCDLHISDVAFEDYGRYRFKLETNLTLFLADHSVILLPPRFWYPVFSEREREREILRKLDFRQVGDQCTPFIASPPELQEGKEGVLTCSWIRCVGAVQWYNKNDEKITEGASSDDSQNAISLRITPSWQDNGKVIQCRRFISDYESGVMCMATSKTTLHVRHTPKGIQTVLLSLLQQVDNEQGTALLKCVVAASNPAVSNYSWYKDGSQIPNQYLQTLTIDNMTTEELGQFSCVAHNEVGQSLPSPSNLVSFTDGLTRSSQDSSSLGGVLIGIWFPAVAVMAVSAAVSTWCCLKKKKKGNAATEMPPMSSEHASGTLCYTDVENTYAALDPTQLSPDYEVVKRQDRPSLLFKHQWADYQNCMNSCA